MLSNLLIKSNRLKYISVYIRYISINNNDLSRFEWNISDNDIESSLTPPSSWYSDPLFYHEIEKKITFRRWIYGGRLDLLKNKGDYIAGNIINEPYIIVRNDNVMKDNNKLQDINVNIDKNVNVGNSDNNDNIKSNVYDDQISHYDDDRDNNLLNGLNAFYNVCRHHAAQIHDDGNGSIEGDRIVCPYHGWEYALNGRLAKATYMKGCKNFKAKDNGLIPIEMDTLGPWAFLNLNGQNDSSSSRSSINDLNNNDDVSGDAVHNNKSNGSNSSYNNNNSNYNKTIKSKLFHDQPDMKICHNLLKKTNYDQLIHVKTKKYHLKCNWKVFIDNYLDGGYHVPIAHKELSNLIDMKSYERIKYDNFFLQQVNSNILSSSVVSSRLQSSSSSSISSNDDDESNNKALYIFHYPNLCINRYGKWMDTNIVWPVNVNECIVEFDWYVDKDMINDTNYINNCLIESEKVQLEDIWLCERVQKGLESSAYKYGGRYAPIMETGEFMFHNLLKNDLSTAIQMMMKKK